MNAIAEKPLMDSEIWALQKAYYSEQKQEAWLSVPYLYTSNRLIAKWTAQLIAQIATRFPNETIHVIELGSGHGMYSYFLYEYLTEFQVKFELTIADLVEANIAYLQSLPQWQGLPVKWCALDLAESIDTLTLNDMPTFVVANYFFDSLPQAAYAKHDGVWKPAYVKVDSGKQSGDLILDFSVQDKHIECAWTKRLLSRYSGSERVLIPETVFNLFAHLKLNKNPVFCIVNDKGFVDKTHLNYCDAYSYHNDGAMATMVNFDAITQWVNERGDGYAVHAANSVENNHVVWYVMNDPDKQYQQGLSMGFMGPSWSDIFQLILGYSQRGALTLADCHFYLELTDYDEAMLERLGGCLAEHLKHSPDDIKNIKSMLLKVCKRIYWHPSRINAFFVLVDLMLKVGMDVAAFSLLEKYRVYAAFDYEFVWRIGVVSYQQQQFEKARLYFEKSRKVNKNCPHAKKYLTLIA